MISLDGQKSQELIRKIKDYESPPQMYSGVFSAIDLEHLQVLADRCFNNESLCQKKLLSSKGALGTMSHPSDQVRGIIEALLRKKLIGILEEPYKIQFTFHRNLFPYGIHSDSGHDPEEWVYKQGIIPLSVEPHRGEVYTIVFSQKCYHSISYPKDLETIQSLTDQEKAIIEALDLEHNISLADLKKYWQGESDIERLRGFDISLPFQWKLGNMAVWDRGHLHCSSDFKNHDIVGKMGLMWVSSRIDSKEKS